MSSNVNQMPPNVNQTLSNVNQMPPDVNKMSPSVNRMPPNVNQMSSDFHKCCQLCTKAFSECPKCLQMSTKCFHMSTECWQMSTKWIKMSTKCLQISTNGAFSGRVHPNCASNQSLLYWSASRNVRLWCTQVSPGVHIITLAFAKITKTGEAHKSLIWHQKIPKNGQAGVKIPKNGLWPPLRYIWVLDVA